MSNRMAWNHNDSSRYILKRSREINLYALVCLKLVYVWSMRHIYWISGVMDCVRERVQFGSIFFIDCSFIRRTITWMRFHVEQQSILNPSIHAVVMRSIYCGIQMHEICIRTKWKSLGYKERFVRTASHAKVIMNISEQRACALV